MQQVQKQGKKEEKDVLESSFQRTQEEEAGNREQRNWMPENDTKGGGSRTRQGGLGMVSASPGGAPTQMSPWGGSLLDGNGLAQFSAMLSH